MANDLSWYTSNPRNTVGKRFPEDRVSLHPTKSGHSVIVFGSKAFADLNLKDDRISFAVQGSRLYFREDSRGWKLTRNSKSSHDKRRLQITHDVLWKIVSAYAGCYLMQYDTEKQLYYVQFKEEN